MYFRSISYTNFNSWVDAIFFSKKLGFTHSPLPVQLSGGRATLLLSKNSKLWSSQAKICMQLSLKISNFWVKKVFCNMFLMLYGKKSDSFMFYYRHMQSVCQHWSNMTMWANQPTFTHPTSFFRLPHMVENYKIIMAYIKSPSISEIYWKVLKPPFWKRPLTLFFLFWQDIHIWRYSQVWQNIYVILL